MYKRFLSQTKKIDDNYNERICLLDKEIEEVNNRILMLK
jgi:hypothetical protein